MQLVELSPGACAVEMVVREDMLNAVGLCHGGVTYALADFAFAVASNSHGQTAVALSATMNYPAAAREGDRLTARAQEQTRSRRAGCYAIKVTREDGTIVGLFTGTVFRRDDPVSNWMSE